MPVESGGSAFDGLLTPTGQAYPTSDPGVLWPIPPAAVNTPLPAPPGLLRDLVVVSRPTASADSEGNVSSGLTQVLASRGTWGTASYRDLQLGAQRGEDVEAVVAMPAADVRDGDYVAVRGKTYVVVTVQDLRTHMRLHLRGTVG